MLGGAALAVATTAERAAFHSHAYDGAADVLFHGAWALGMSVIAALIACVGVGLGFFWAIGFTMHPSTRRLVTVGAATGGVFGAVAYRMVVLPSKFGALLNPWLGMLITGALVLVLGAISLPLGFRAMRRWPRIAMGTVTLAAVAVAYVDLHRYMRSYGNVHLILGIAMLLALGLVGTGLLQKAQPRTRRITVGVTAAMVVISFSAIAIFEPTPGARHGVLIYGGVEKTLIRHVLWPALDGDGDGYPSLAWGVDCDDDDPSSHPIAAPLRSRHFDCKAISNTADKPQATDKPQAGRQTASNPGGRWRSRSQAKCGVGGHRHAASRRHRSLSQTLRKLRELSTLSKLRKRYEDNVESAVRESWLPANRIRRGVYPTPQRVGLSNQVVSRIRPSLVADDAEPNRGRVLRILRK